MIFPKYSLVKCLSCILDRPLIFKKEQLFIFYSKFHKSKFSSTTRGNFKTLASKDVDFFVSVLGKSRAIQDIDELESYNTDWLKSHKGNFEIVETLLKLKNNMETPSHQCNLLLLYYMYQIMLFWLRHIRLRFSTLELYTNNGQGTKLN